MNTPKMILLWNIHCNWIIAVPLLWERMEIMLADYHPWCCINYQNGYLIHWMWWSNISLTTHWKLRDVIMPTSSLMAVLAIVITTIFSAISNDKVNIMMTLTFQCFRDNKVGIMMTLTFQCFTRQKVGIMMTLTFEYLAFHFALSLLSHESYTENCELSWCQLCHHWRYHRLSLWQPVVPTVMTKLASWQLSAFNAWGFLGEYSRENWP